MRETTVLSLSYGQIVVKPPEKLHGLVPESFETYQIVEPSDIIVRPTDLQNDWNSLRFGLSRNRGIITSAYMCLYTKDIVTREYGHLLLHTYDLKKVFYGLGSGLRQNLSWMDFKYLPCLVPPPPEQAAIVEYLDKTTAKIDEAIDKNQRLIELLKELKAILINQAVTKGLKPNVPMRDSGVEGLGEVPVHWKMRRLKYATDMRVSNVDKHIKEGEKAVRLCNYVDVYKNDYISEQMNFMRVTATAEEIGRFRLKEGDVLITKDSETWNDIGVPALVTEAASDLISGYHLALLRPQTNELAGGYLLRALQSKNLAYQFHVEAKGVTRYGLSQDSIKSVWLPIPPFPEQTAIAEYLNETTAEIDEAIDKKQRLIELLKELKPITIAEAVTGKIKV